MKSCVSTKLNVKGLHIKILVINMFPHKRFFCLRLIMLFLSSSITSLFKCMSVCISGSETNTIHNTVISILGLCSHPPAAALSPLWFLDYAFVLVFYNSC